MLIKTVRVAERPISLLSRWTSLQPKEKELATTFSKFIRVTIVSLHPVSNRPDVAFCPSLFVFVGRRRVQGNCQDLGKFCCFDNFVSLPWVSFYLGALSFMSLSVAFFGKKDLVYIYLRAWFDYGGTFFPVLFLGGNRTKRSGVGLQPFASRTYSLAWLKQSESHFRRASLTEFPSRRWCQYWPGSYEALKVWRW